MYIKVVKNQSYLYNNDIDFVFISTGSCNSSLYSEISLNRTSLGAALLVGIDRYLVHTG